MTTREKFLKAREHIQAKEYNEARAILITINHPKAEDWLNRLDQLDSQPALNQAPTRSSRSSKRGMLLVGMVSLFMMVAIAGLVFIAPQITPLSDVAQQSATADYPLARYFPDDTVGFANIRVDDKHIQSWDTLVVHIQESLPAFITNMVIEDEPYTLTYALDLMAQAALNEDFQITVRSWLGDEMAIGAFNFPTTAEAFRAQEHDIGLIIAVDITNREGTITFLEQLFALDPDLQFDKSERNGFTIYLYTDGTWGLMVSDETLFVVTPYAMSLLESGVPNPLLDAPQFIETMSLLPEPQYHAAIYADVGQYFRILLPITESIRMEFAETFATMPDNSMMPMGFLNASYEDFLPEGMTLEDLYENIGQIAGGFTIVDDYTVLLDGAFNIGDPELGKMFNVINPELATVDPAFLAYLPENTAFVSQGTDINAQVAQSIRAETMQREMIESNPEVFNMLSPDSLELEPIQTAIIKIDEVIQPAVGLTVQEDILGWMTGDYAIFATYDPNPKSMLFSYYYDELLEQNIEFGIVIEVTDTAKAQSLVDSLGTMVSLAEVEVEFTTTYEDIAGHSVAVVSFPMSDSNQVPFELVIGSNDEVLVFATRQVATDILNKQGGFDQSAEYAQVQPRLLSGAYSSTFIGNDGFDLIADALTGLMQPLINELFNAFPGQLSDEQTANIEEHELQMKRQMRASLPMIVQSTRIFTDLFDSITITTTMTDDLDMQSRFTLSFAD